MLGSLAGTMIRPLEGQELMHGADRFGIRGFDAHLASPGQLAELVPDSVFPRSHHIGARHGHRMHRLWGTEVSCLERDNNLVQMLPDLVDPG